MPKRKQRIDRNLQRVFQSCNFTMPKRKQSPKRRRFASEFCCNFTMPKRKLYLFCGLISMLLSCNFTMPKRKLVKPQIGPRDNSVLQLYHAKAETRAISPLRPQRRHRCNFTMPKRKPKVLFKCISPAARLQLYHAKAETCPLPNCYLVFQVVATLPCQSGNKAQLRFQRAPA